MKKLFIFFLIIFISGKSFSQVEGVYFFPKGEDKFNVGFGASVKFSIPVSDAAYATIEGAFDYASITSSYNQEGIAILPIKLGYRYTVNGTGIGFYIEPQAGYNVSGAFTNDVKDIKINGFEWAGNIGYLFERKRKIQFDISLRYETSYYKGGSFNFIALRLAHNFSFGRRDSDE